MAEPFKVLLMILPIFCFLPMSETSLHHSVSDMVICTYSIIKY